MAITKHYYERFHENQFYHIYNRTVDRTTMFRSEDNYRYFLQRYDHYLSPVLDTFAYCLLGNHFHLLVRIKDLATIAQHSAHNIAPGTTNLTHDFVPRTADLTTLREWSNLTRAELPRDLPHDAPDLTTFRKLSNLPREGLAKHQSAHDLVSHQFRKFFQSYAMAYNKQHGRIGTLFQTPFKRAIIDNDRYFRNIVCYIHHNPQQHRLIDDFRKWPWSSYGRMLTDSISKLAKEEVLNWFGGKEEYTAIHSSPSGSKENDNLLIDDE